MPSLRWRPALAVALVAAGVVTACETVPYTGRSQLQFMSPQQESQLGAQAYQQTLAKARLSSDAAASEMVTRDENGLAAVLGHEIGHVIARHGGERVSQQMLVNVGLETTMAALSLGNPATVQAVASLLGAGATVGVLLPWSRAQESEADHLGLILMAKAGYDPHAARDLWVRMAAASQGSGKPPEFLSTHPSEPTRIQQIEVWMPEAMQFYHPR
jgi:metalloendopeptidase OMA1, mitochondrial